MYLRRTSMSWLGNKLHKVAQTLGIHASDSAKAAEKQALTDAQDARNAAALQQQQVADAQKQQMDAMTNLSMESARLADMNKSSTTGDTGSGAMAVAGGMAAAMDRRKKLAQPSLSTALGINI
jgi:hypothetical protein